MKLRPWLILISFSLLILAPACTPIERPSAVSDWKYSHLRQLDPVDAPQPSQDIIALYSRHTRHDLELRLDLLDLSGHPESDFYIAIDMLPRGTVKLPFQETASREWDLLISIPMDGPPTIEYLPPHSGQLPTPRVIWDLLLDTVTLRLNANLLPRQSGAIFFQAFTIQPGTQHILDKLEPISSEDQPMGRAPLLLAFWNTLPAHTPAQALRRWDGAHTGPLGQRHGLKHLLEAAEHHQVPVMLLDLKSPLSVSALDALGAIPWIKSLAGDKIITIPDSLPANYFGNTPAWVNQQAAKISREKTLDFGLPGSQFLYQPHPNKSDHQTYPLIISREPVVSEDQVAQTDVFRFGDKRVLPIPETTSIKPQVTSDGLDLEIKRMLLQSAIASNSSITALGGDLPHTNWGDALFVGENLRYIAAHPWIWPLRESDLMTRKPIPGYKPVVPSPTFPAIIPVYKALQNAPDSHLSDLAWQAFLALSAPADPMHADLPELRANYLDVIDDLLIAAKWDETLQDRSLAMRKPEIVTDCEIWTESTNHPRCALYNDTFFALFNPRDASLRAFFLCDENGSTQIVAPSSQFAVGLSSPNTWLVDQGELIDPAIIPGAFSGPAESYEIIPIPGGLRFSSPSILKDYQLTGTGLRVEIDTHAPIQMQVPLAVAPERRFAPGWATQYQIVEPALGSIFGTTAGYRVLITSSGSLSRHNFSEDLSALLLPENPDYDYPPGHYIPFPMEIINISSNGSFWIQWDVSW